MTSPVSIARSLFGREKTLAGVGALGLALAAFCAAMVLLRGSAVVPPGGDLTKPVSFDAAIGIWTLTIAALLPYADFGPRGRRAWRVLFVAAMLYFYFGETWAAFRGHDPRFFSGDFGAFDGTVAALFGLDAALVILLFAVFASRFFTRRARAAAPLLVQGVRWAVVSTLVAFGVGIWMIAMEGRMVGPSGSALWPHALGFHALQAVPVVAWLARSAGEGFAARATVHLAGAAWLGATLAALAQAAGGRPPLEASPALLALAVSLVAWLAAAGAAATRLLPTRATA